jgi:hypothetical protein
VVSWACLDFASFDLFSRFVQVKQESPGPNTSLTRRRKQNDFVNAECHFKVSQLLGGLTFSRASSTLANHRINNILVDDETCWNSKQGVQFLQMHWPHVIHPQMLKIKFQGGFAAKHIHLNATNRDVDLYPNDDTGMQEFQVDLSTTNSIKLSFESFDFYGRIVIYYLDVLGANSSDSAEPSQ